MNAQNEKIQAAPNPVSRNQAGLDRLHNHFSPVASLKFQRQRPQMKFDGRLLNIQYTCDLLV